MNADAHRVRSVFLTAVENHTPEDWGDYLDEACAGDRDLRRQVEALLRAHGQPNSLLDHPGPVVALTAEEAVSERPGTVIGPYKLLEQIGEGGFGVVFLAEQQRPVRRKVALKVIKPGMDTKQVVARFEAERQALALMDHPNIAHVYDGGATDSGRPFFVMELVKGAPITDFCDQNHLSIRQRLELFVSVCSAVQHAHQKGIIHRDLKPSNVLATVQDGTAVVKVIDFGIAKATGRQLTDRTLFTGLAQMIGTPLYMSPEQALASGLDIDTRSDIYSLGVLLYELLTGTTPFDQERLQRVGFDEVRRIIREEEPPRPSTRIRTLAEAVGAERKRLAQSLRGELDWVVMKALEKDRNRRYETASAFAADVERYLRDEPVQACPPSTWYRFRKFARRNRRALATLGVLTLAALVALGSLAVSYARISEEARQKALALAASQASEQEAVENLKDALAAVDQMLTRVSEERLQFVPQMEPVRRELLQDALKFYERFLERRGNDPAVRREAALAYRRVGFLQYQLGDYGKAEEGYRKAFAMLDELDAESPLGPATRSDLVYANIESSLVLNNEGKTEEREKALRRAVALAEGLVTEFQDEPGYRDQLINSSNRLADAVARREPVEAEKVLRRNLALGKHSTDPWLRGQTWLTLGGLLASQGRHAEAEEASRQAIPFFEKAVEQWPLRPWMHMGVVMALDQLAAAVDAQGRSEEAEEPYRRSIAILDKWAGDYPTGPHYRWGQANTRFRHATLLMKLKRTEEAKDAYRRVVELSDKLADDFPSLPGYRWTAVDRRRVFAEFLVEIGQVREAQEVYDGASAILATLEASERCKALTGRGHFYAGLGEWDKAAGDFTKAIELGSENVMGVWCPLALLHLRAGRTDEYRSLCEKSLERSESHWVVGFCTLTPRAVTDGARLVRIAEQLVAREPRNAYHMAILGSTLYRQGDLDGAIQNLEGSLRSSSDPSMEVSQKLFLAMAYHRSGRTTEARQLVQEVTRWMEENAEKLRKGAGSQIPPAWMYRLGLQRLHREAEEVLKQDLGNESQRSDKKQKPD